MKGTYRKRGSTWSYQVELGRDPDTGKRHQKSKGGFDTKKKAEAACAEIITKFEKGEYAASKKMTVSSFLELWLKDYAKGAMRQSTYSNRSAMIEKKINPVLGEVELEKLTPSSFNKFYTKLRDEGLSTDYVHSIHALLRSALNKAYQWQIVQTKVMDRVDAPRIAGKDIKTWSMEEIRSFLFASEANICCIGFVLAIFTGMRRGEVLGIRWRDIDLITKKLSVRQTLYWTPEERVIFQEPKTKNAKRQISLPDVVIIALQKQFQIQQNFKELLGLAYEDLDLVCCRENGAPIKPRNFLENFLRMINAANINRVRFHDLRHTHATLMLQLGEHPKVVSERLGHSRVGITMDIYSHVLPDMQKEASDRFEQAILNLPKVPLETL